MLDRLRERIIVDDNGCWIWQRRLLPGGYGTFSVTQSRSGLAHRLMYEELVGPIPDGMHLDHLCRVRACCNPEHLEPVTPLENLARGRTNLTKTHCKWGHEFSDENTYVVPRTGARHCRTCTRDRHRKAVA